MFTVVTPLRAALVSRHKTRYATAAVAELCGTKSAGFNGSYLKLRRRWGFAALGHR